MGAVCMVSGVSAAAAATIKWESMTCGGGTPGLDHYNSVDTPAAAPLRRNPISLFANELWYVGGATPVPLNQDLSLTHFYKKLPPSVRPHLHGLYQLAVTQKLPISFRVTQAVTAEGVTVPRFHFFKSTPLECGPGSAGGGPSGASSGIRPPSPMSLTIGMVGAAGIIVAYDHFVLKSLIDNGLLPEEARIPALFGSVYLASMALHQLGVFATGPRAMLAHMPTFYGFQLLSYFLLEKAGMDLNSPVTQFAGLTLASMPYALAAVSPTMAHALGIKSSAALQASRGAAVLRVGAVLTRALGWIGLIDLGARGALWAVSRLAFKGDERRQWDLIRLSQQIYLQERGSEMHGGRFLASAFGMFITAIDTVASAVSSSYEKNYDANLDRIQNKLTKASQQFGDSMRQNLTALVMKNTRNENGVWAIDWKGVRRSVREFYQDDKNKKNIKRAYELVKEYTGFHPDASDADDITKMISPKGTISNMKAFKRFMSRHARIEFLRVRRRLEHKGRSLGLVQDNPAGGYQFIHPSHLNSEQRAFMKNEGARLTVRLLQLRSFRLALKNPS